jgi:hypothetical protein
MLHLRPIRKAATIVLIARKREKSADPGDGRAGASLNGIFEE